MMGFVQKYKNVFSTLFKVKTSHFLLRPIGEFIIVQYVAGICTIVHVSKYECEQ